MDDRDRSVKRDTGAPDRHSQPETHFLENHATSPVSGVECCEEMGFWQLIRGRIPVAKSGNGSIVG